MKLFHGGESLKKTENSGFKGCKEAPFFKAAVMEKRRGAAFHELFFRIIGLIAVIMLGAALTGCSGSGESRIEQGMQAIADSRYAEALDYFEAGLKNGEDEELSYRGMGIAHMGLSKYSAAILDFEAALQSCRGSISNLEYDISFYLAVAQFRDGDYEGAVKTYDAILDLDRKNPDAFFLRGKTQLAMGLKDEALRDFNAAVRFKADDPDLYIDIYECMVDAGFENEGSGFLKNAMELTHINTYQKGKLYFWMGEYESAKSALEEARGDNSDSHVILYLGKTYEALGDKSYAASLYKTYLEDNPEDVAICNQLGLCEMDVGNYEGALKAFQQGISAGDSETMQSLKFNEIVAYEYLSDFKQAAVLMEDYLKAYPEDEAALREYTFLSTR